MPFVYKRPDSPYEVIALIDIDKAAQSFFGESDDRALAILNDEGQVLYTLGSMNQDQLPTFEAGQKAVLKDGTYYFAEAGSDGLTYVSAVPYSHVSSRTSRLTGGLSPSSACRLAWPLPLPFPESQIAQAGEADFNNRAEQSQQLIHAGIRKHHRIRSDPEPDSRAVPGEGRNTGAHEQA